MCRHPHPHVRIGTPSATCIHTTLGYVYGAGILIGRLSEWRPLIGPLSEWRSECMCCAVLCCGGVYQARGPSRQAGTECMYAQPLMTTRAVANESLFAKKSTRWGGTSLWSSRRGPGCSQAPRMSLSVFQHQPFNPRLISGLRTTGHRGLRRRKPQALGMEFENLLSGS